MIDIEKTSAPEEHHILWSRLRDSYNPKMPQHLFYDILALKSQEEHNAHIMRQESIEFFLREATDMLQQPHITHENYALLCDKAECLLGEQAEELLQTTPVVQKIAMRSVTDAIQLQTERDALIADIKKISDTPRELEDCYKLKDLLIKLYNAYDDEEKKQKQCAYEISLVDREIWFLEENLQALLDANQHDLHPQRIHLTQKLIYRLDRFNALQSLLETVHTPKEKRAALLELLSTHDMADEEYQDLTQQIMALDLHERIQEIEAAGYHDLTYYTRMLYALSLLAETLKDGSSEKSELHTKIKLFHELKSYTIFRNHVLTQIDNTESKADIATRLASLEILLSRTTALNETFNTAMETNWITDRIEAYTREQTIAETDKMPEDTIENLSLKIRSIRDVILKNNWAENRRAWEVKLLACLEKRAALIKK